MNGPYGFCTYTLIGTVQSFQITIIALTNINLIFLDTKLSDFYIYIQDPLDAAKTLSECFYNNVKLCGHLLLFI